MPGLSRPGVSVSEMTETKEGRITRVIFSNESNGYVVAVFETEDEQFTLTGNFHMVNLNSRYRVEGEFRTHKRYGEQFCVTSYEEMVPEDSDGIRTFLASGSIKGVGPKTADAIVDAFGDRSLDVIENEPGKLLGISGIGTKTLASIVESYRETRDFAKIYSELSDMGIDMAQAVKIFKLYGEESLNVIRENPYSLVEDVYGISFRKADQIAERIGVDRDSEFRIKSGIKFILKSFAGSGSTFMPKEILVGKTIDLLDVSTEQIDDELVHMAFEGEIQTDAIDDVPVIYLYDYFMAEQRVASELCVLKEAKIAPIPADLDNLINDAEAHESIELSDEQRSAVRTALSNNMTIITGGPGTGKTTIINVIVKALKRCEISTAIAAPTGRAAKRITETSGIPAMTIHRMLEYVYSEDEEDMEFGKDEDDPLEEDAIIIDEASMVDLMLMDGLLRAIKPGSRLIVVGDVDQLPSVGAGNVLRDMIRSEYITTVKLREIFRQAEESLIVVNAHRINNGEYPEANESDKDFFLMSRENDNDILDSVKELISGRLEKYYDFIGSSADIQILTPTRKGILGTVNLNQVLQETLNPAAPDRQEKKFGSRIYREGDKVMQIRNNYSMGWRSEETFETGQGVFNGDMGIVDTVNTEFGRVTVRYDDRIVVYEADELDELELAYAVTVHKSQGSEFRAVIMPMTWFPPMLQTRDLLYTAVTRGKNLVVIVGKEESMRRMIDNDRVDARYTGLEYRLRERDMGAFR